MLATNLPKTNKKLVVLKGEAFNAIVDALKEKPLTQPGYSFADRQSPNTYEDKSEHHYFYFNAPYPLPYRSVFGVTNAGATFNDPCILTVDFPSTTNLNLGSPFGLFTNIQPYTPGNGPGVCKPIDFYEPTLLYCSDPAFFPNVGMPCGPDNNPATEWGISSLNFGLLCISQRDPVTNNCWCIRTPDPFALIGTVVNADIQPKNPVTGFLGLGTIQVQFKNYATTILQNAFGPNGALLQLPVWNTGKTTFKIGDSIKVIQVTGVGLVIVDSTNLIYGRVKDSNIKHFQSGLVSIYTGAPGTETWDGITAYTCFNHKEEVVRGEWCFLTPSGNSAIPYYIISTQCNGKILGQVTSNVQFNNSVNNGDSYQPFNVDVFAGDPGVEIDTGFNITAQASHGFFGAIPAGTFVECIYVAGDINKAGAWYITRAKKGWSFSGVIVDGQANSSDTYIDVEEDVQVKLLDGKQANHFTGITVTARVRYFPVLNLEHVQLEWNGDTFVITHGELEGGLQCLMSSGSISDNGTGFVEILPVGGNSQIPAASVPILKVTSPMGPVENGRRVRVFRNAGGFQVGVKSCI